PEPFGEVVVEGDFVGEKGNWYRAILVDGSGLLAENSCVLRWIDAGGDLIAKSGATLWGRASAQGTVSLARGVRFQRVGAPRIVFDGEPKNRPVQTRTY